MAVEEIDEGLLEFVRDGLGGAVPFAKHVGIVVEHVGDGVATASLAPSDLLLNHVATVHAGALFTLAETGSGAAMAGAFASLLGEIRPVVSDATIEFLRPATAPLRATARSSEGGAALRASLAAADRVTFDVTVDISDGRDRKVAVLTATWVVKRVAGERSEPR